MSLISTLGWKSPLTAAQCRSARGTGCGKKKPINEPKVRAFFCLFPPLWSHKRLLALLSYNRKKKIHFKYCKISIYSAEKWPHLQVTSFQNPDHDWRDYESFHPSENQWSSPLWRLFCSAVLQLYLLHTLFGFCGDIIRRRMRNWCYVRSTGN